MVLSQLAMTQLYHCVATGNAGKVVSATMACISYIVDLWALSSGFLRISGGVWTILSSFPGGM